jgi:hypothetical protein
MPILYHLIIARFDCCLFSYVDVSMPSIKDWLFLVAAFYLSAEAEPVSKMLFSENNVL